MEHICQQGLTQPNSELQQVSRTEKPPQCSHLSLLTKKGEEKRTSGRSHWMLGTGLCLEPED